MLNGKRAIVTVGFPGNESRATATIIAYPSEGDFAIVRLDGEAEPVTVHRSRVGNIIRAAKEGEA